ncbi:hypothetical protein F4819DRAFT_492750 [Hypoxylon fuscum]|nr:hypothetical protein F4819DRAFT_492750 [Hypoxylon fuscum]
MEFEDDADQNTRVFHPGALDKKMLVMPAWPQNGTDVWVLKTPMGLGARTWSFDAARTTLVLNFQRKVL